MLRGTMPRPGELSADRDGDRDEYYCHDFFACHFIYFMTLEYNNVMSLEV